MLVFVDRRRFQYFEQLNTKPNNKRFKDYASRQLESTNQHTNQSFSHAIRQAHNPSSRQQQSNVSDILRNMRSQAGQAAPVRVKDGATASLPGLVDFFGAAPAPVPAPKVKKPRPEPQEAKTLQQQMADLMDWMLKIASEARSFSLTLGGHGFAKDLVAECAKVSEEMEKLYKELQPELLKETPSEQVYLNIMTRSNAVNYDYCVAQDVAKTMVRSVKAQLKTKKEHEEDEQEHTGEGTSQSSRRVKPKVKGKAKPKAKAAA